MAKAKDYKFAVGQKVQYFLPEWFNERTNQWESAGAYETDLKKYRSYAAAERALKYAYGLKDSNRRIRIETLVVESVEEQEYND